MVAESGAYNRLKGTLTLPVQPVTYTVTVTADGGATGILPSGTQDFTAVLSSNDFQTGLPQDFTWTLDNTTGVTYQSGTSVNVNGTDPSKATLTAAWNEAGPITVKATPTSASTYPGVSGTATIPMTTVTYTVNIKDGTSSANTVTGTTVDTAIGYSANFTTAVTSTPPGAHPSNNWAWTSDNTAVATVSGSGSSATVSIPAAATVGQTATINATNTDDSTLTASFTVRAKEPTPADVAVGGTVKVDNVEYIVLVKDATVNGKANGESTTSNHKAALLLSKNMYGSQANFDSSSNKWNTSAIRTTLNGTYLTAYPTVAAKAIEVTLDTRGEFNDNAASNKQTTNDKVFLLSEADVFGTSNRGVDTSPQLWEYTYNNTQIPHFSSIATGSEWWLRSPAYSNVGISKVNPTGTVASSGPTGLGGVRPAFWYNLDP